MKRKNKKTPRPVRVAPSIAAFHIAMRNTPDLVWLVSPLDLEVVLEALDSSPEVWDEDEQNFASFPTAHETIVCLNLDYLQLAQLLEPTPELKLSQLPEDRVRIWLDGRSDPILVSASEPELLAFQTFLETNESVSVVRWVNAEGLAVTVRIVEIVALEYPAYWGSEADDDVFGQRDDVILF